VSHVTFIRARRPGADWSSGPALPQEASLRPEPADVLRLGRRLVRIAVSSARADEAPTPARLLVEHLGPDALSLPVVGEGWATWEHVNLQGALDRWTQAPGRSSTLVGLTGRLDDRVELLGDLDVVEAGSLAEVVPRDPELEGAGVARVPVDPAHVGAIGAGELKRCRCAIGLREIAIKCQIRREFVGRPNHRIKLGVGVNCR